MRKIQSRENTVVSVLLFCLIIAYLGAMCIINFSGRPDFYDSDMYSDLCYTAEAWKNKTLFPDGWVFGNQLYAVSTPVLAAIFCGVFSSPLIAMAAASTIMGILVLVSYNWMMKPVLSNSAPRLLSILLFMTLPLFFGDAVGTTNGWQLFFTMCSYYACYAITAFLAFGCYIRSYAGPSLSVVLVLACVMSFGTGIQSLRQTAVMTGALIAAEVFHIIACLVNKEKEPFRSRSMRTALLLCICNLAGVVFNKILKIAHTEIFGEIKLSAFSELLPSFLESIESILTLLLYGTRLDSFIFASLAILCVVSCVMLVWKAFKLGNKMEMILFFLFLVSMMSVMAVDVFTTMRIRPIYYFMLYPMIAFLIGYIFSEWRRLGKYIVLGFMLFIVILTWNKSLLNSCQKARNKTECTGYKISEYMLENGYTTVFTQWNQGEEIAIASDFEISAGFWHGTGEPFVCVNYLCNPKVFDVTPERVVYAFCGMETAEQYVRIAQTKEIDLTLDAYFPDGDIYLYTAPENLMKVFSH